MRQFTNTFSYENPDKETSEKKLLLSEYLKQSRFNPEKSLLLKYNHVLLRIIDKDLGLEVNETLTTTLKKDFLFDERIVDRCLSPGNCYRNRRDFNSHHQKNKRSPNYRSNNNYFEGRRNSPRNFRRSRFTPFFNKKHPDNYVPVEDFKVNKLKNENFYFYDNFRGNENPEKSVYSFPATFKNN